MTPLISVVVPTYNRPGPLRHALSSIAAQREVPGTVETVIVNDGGTDVTAVADEARELGMQLNLVSLGHNHGLATARNIGMERARGEYVAFLDDDDVYLPQHLRVTLSALGTGDADLAYTRCAVQQTRVDPGHPPPLPEGAAFPFDPELLSVANFMPVHTAVLRRPAHARFDPGLPALEDWDIWLRLLREHHYRFVHVPKPR
jgi:glycosyltransferase involved in cell wall biosynthesis